jgi:hypothetical protein
MHPNGTFYLRERVPRDIVTTANKREVVLPMEGQNRIVKLGEFIKLSLETKEPALARDRYRSVAAEVQELWRRFRQELTDGPVKLTTKQVSALAGRYYQELCTQFEQEPGDALGWDESAYLVQSECCRAQCLLQRTTSRSNWRAVTGCGSAGIMIPRRWRG